MSMLCHSGQEIPMSIVPIPVDSRTVFGVMWPPIRNSTSSPASDSISTFDSVSSSRQAPPPVFGPTLQRLSALWDSSASHPIIHQYAFNVISVPISNTVARPNFWNEMRTGSSNSAIATIFFKWNENRGVRGNQYFDGSSETKGGHLLVMLVSLMHSGDLCRCLPPDYKLLPGQLYCLLPIPNSHSQIWKNDNSQRDAVLSESKGIDNGICDGRINRGRQENTAPSSGKPVQNGNSIIRVKIVISK